MMEIEQDLDFKIGKFNIKSLLNKDILLRINKIIRLKYEDIKLNKNNNKIERSLPSEEKFVKCGWYRFMLARYLIATKFTRDKLVLDSCAGLGWGSYILASNSKRVYANDYDKESLNFINSYWKDKKIKILFENALNLKLTEKVDVVVAMESIEHFNKKDGVKYIKNLTNCLVNKGVLVGSSSFPLSKKDAIKLCSTNPYHKYIYTLEEIYSLFRKYFEEVQIFERKIFICKNLIRN